MDIRTVGVVGAGLMGSGIAEIAARSGYDVVVREVDEAALQRGLKHIERSLARGIERGKMTEKECAEVGLVQRGAGLLEAFLAEARIVDPLLPVDGHACPA